MSTTMKDRSEQQAREVSFDPVGPPTPPEPPEGAEAAPPWEVAVDPPPVDDGQTMPRRAAKLPSQNGPAMRSVFAYLLDEDDPPELPAGVAVTSPRPDPHRR